MFYKTALVLSLAVASLALPTANGVEKRAAGAVLAAGQSYADFQVSDGVGGNALAEVQAKFPIDESDLANVSADDLKTIQAARKIAESAETDAGGFNDAIAKAGSSSAAGKALSVGKIKNKVLKLKLEVLGLQIEQAQGKDTASQIAAETTKLNNNIKIDGTNKGAASQSVDFSAGTD